MYNVLTVAKYFVYLAKKEKRELTHLKLQKILYFAQGYYLSWKNEPLCYNSLEAWRFGPVFPDLYYEMRAHSSVDLCTTSFGGHKPVSIDTETESFLEWIWNNFKSWSASDLVTLTHTHSSWIKAFYEEDHVMSELDIAREFKEKYKK